MSCPCESTAPCVQEAFVTVPVAHAAPAPMEDGLTLTACFDCGLDLATPLVLAMILTVLARTMRRLFGDRLIVGRLDRLSGEQVGRPAPHREAAVYSTVTLLARLRGWSTSQPRRSAM
jgi:hypothetical protein